MWETNFSDNQATGWNKNSNTLDIMGRPSSTVAL